MQGLRGGGGPKKIHRGKRAAAAHVLSKGDIQVVLRVQDGHVFITIHLVLFGKQFLKENLCKILSLLFHILDCNPQNVPRILQAEFCKMTWTLRTLGVVVLQCIRHIRGSALLKELRLQEDL